MVFLYSKEAGKEEICLSLEQFLHLRARRVEVGDRIDVRNLNDSYNYIYEIREIARKKISLELVLKHSIKQLKKELIIAWSVVEAQVIEKTLPMLNEMGVLKLILVYSDFSQKNIKLDLQRFERILIQSSQQCGREDLLQIEVVDSSDEFFSRYKGIVRVDFDGKMERVFLKDFIYFIGAEGGFSQREREMFKDSIALNSPYILRSNSAILAVTSKIIF
ncbi:16S rRNA (uracil(1498)-N(3))-methyltransferase [uncultured Campylobacter sp.]|uniref:16S rRNA (uracil(1498)-N(3))-methyltransferase n=1 Tax=uncultured Campylobacter sp. TaxID=218934 RepID=UPI00261391B3|nr:16S rRNA (uracil(1498)-N(3))-methyltransferase [uncultured Campylobacter sp.]